ncbi:FMN-dependent dehydrogenase-domain-containing protein [Aspergillus caelatus]|uniref:L-lactate dehydrogenase (cytochrome) n=2 Tax=Aspergillus subgen. Circumdati TaxID=2720871 RepID=A0A5N7A8F4_9EURO|nr:FMN-dependent dehydrogenase-domain-containing protein [Aspergillus caelatus]KAE8364830.1 FMN-dependent dehydrogenase-domain-containing protein [Aspergillus caelatus]KAE8411863.1 FMN-dependent dehydrogenase-domain-containing protein [Aspergillus pseudocaelatus]
MADKALLSVRQISEHNAVQNCWIVVDKQVWDVTEFLEEHPGGSSIILKYAGRDATKAYSEVHAPSVLAANLPQDKHMGVLDESTIDDEWVKQPPTENPKVVHDHEKPPLHTLINSHDFELVASKTASKKTWAFYSSAATDLITRDANKSCFDRIWFRPRVLKDVRSVDTKTKILGVDSSLPLFVSPAAMAKLIHPDGECAIARACGNKGIMQGISNNSSYTMEELRDTAPSASFFFQLYVNRDREKSAALLRQCSANPNVKAIFVTVDAAWPGKREADERVKADEGLSVPMAPSKAKNDNKGGGLGRVMAGFIDPGLTWEDLVWVRQHTHLPVCLKGVMSADDAMLAMEAGLDGILLSNHGGRNLDTSPPSIITLLELQKRCPEIFDKMEIYVDSGIRRGTDILKAICLGATAVGMGRSMLFATNYGQEGVEHLIEIIKDELETAMRNNGITTLDEAGPHLVHTADIDHLVPESRQHPYARKVAKGRRSLHPSKL